jgi:hypothetical protein
MSSIAAFQAMVRRVVPAVTSRKQSFVRCASLGEMIALIALGGALGCARHDANRNDTHPSVIGSAVSSAPTPVANAHPAASSPVEMGAFVALAKSSEPAAKAHRVLHVGDSMVPLVANYIKPVVTRNGGSYESISISSSTTGSWAETHQLRDAVAKLDPDLVLISLGSNDLFVRDLDARARDIRQIVAEVGGRACLWVGPPAWAKDFGFLQTLRESAGGCGYFDSSVLRFERQADGRHPTWGSSYRWASAVWKRLGGTEDLPSG